MYIYNQIYNGNTDCAMLLTPASQLQYCQLTDVLIQSFVVSDDGGLEVEGLVKTLSD